MILIENLNVHYGSNWALRDINLEIKTGETLALIGESGAGKTTLGLSLMGLCQGKIEGHIFLDGQDILMLSEEQLRQYRWNRTSIVFQHLNDSLNPTVPVLDQVIEPMVHHGLLKRKNAVVRARNLFREQGLPESTFKRYPAQMSGGEVRRVLIAMALANDPEALILDEPTSALDSGTKQEILNLLEKVLKNKHAIVITHDLDVANRLSRKIVILYGGRIVEMGDTEIVLGNPRHPYTRGLIRSHPSMEATKDLQGITGNFRYVTGGCPFQNRCTQSINLCYEKTPEPRLVNDRYISCHRGGIICLLQVIKISMSYNGEALVLNQLGFKLLEGESMAIVGESGCGKTTLAHCIMGIKKIQEGSIHFEGNNLQERDREFYSKVQIIYQNPRESISPRFNVFKAVKEPLDIQGLGDENSRRENVMRALKEAQLPTNKDFLIRYPHQLSGGELQRIAIARALVLGPKVLIADEPTASLDVSIQAKVLKLILHLQEKKGLSMLFITHDIALARRVCDRIAVMAEGTIVEEGSVADILNCPQNQYTKKLLARNKT